MQVEKFMSGFFLRLAFSIAALIIMLVAAVIALGYFVYALFVYLEGQMSPPLAAVVTGILVLLLAAFLVFRHARYPGITGRLTGRPDSRQPISAIKLAAGCSDPRMLIRRARFLQHLLLGSPSASARNFANFCSMS